MIEAICLLWFWCRVLRGWPPPASRSSYVAPYSASTTFRVRGPRLPLARGPRPSCSRRASRRREHAVLDGDGVALVRPYVVYAEQRRRRRQLELALDGHDQAGPMWIHGVRMETAA